MKHERLVVLSYAAILASILAIAVGVGQVLALNSTCNGHAVSSGGPNNWTLVCSGDCPPEYPNCTPTTFTYPQPDGTDFSVHQCSCMDGSGGGMSYTGDSQCFFQLITDPVPQGGTLITIVCLQVSCPEPCAFKMVVEPGGNTTAYCECEGVRTN